MRQTNPKRNPIAVIIKQAKRQSNIRENSKTGLIQMGKQIIVMADDHNAPKRR